MTTTWHEIEAWRQAERRALLVRRGAVPPARGAEVRDVVASLVAEGAVDGGEQTSVVNFGGGGTTSAHAVVAVGADRALSMYLSRSADVVLDLQGWFASDGVGGLRFVERRRLLGESEALKAERNDVSRRIGEAIKAGSAPDGPEVAELRARLGTARHPDEVGDHEPRAYFALLRWLADPSAPLHPSIAILSHELIFVTDDVAGVAARLERLPREILWNPGRALWLLGTGTVDHVPLYPREIARRALEHHASAVVLVHNHPSGDPTPSSADIAMTRKVAAALATIDVALHDHAIVGRNRVLSMRSAGHF